MKNYLTQKQKANIENISKVAYIKKSHGGSFSQQAFKNEDGLHINIQYDYEYINRWGWDMSEIRITTDTLSKEDCLKILETRTDLKEEILSYNCKLN